MTRKKLNWRAILIVGVVVFGLLVFRIPVYGATYDATGTWDYTMSNIWVNPGNAGCYATATSFTSTAIMTQSGRAIQLLIIVTVQRIQAV